MEIEGMIIRDLGQFEGISKAGNPWKKHEWVLETTSQYPRKVKFTVFGDKVNTLTFELGKSYVLQVDVESREFNERWYTDITAFNARPAENSGIQVQSGGMSQTPVNPFPPQQNQTPSFGQSQVQENPFGAGSTDFSNNDSQEDLPF